MNAFYAILTIHNIKFYMDVNSPVWASKNQLKCEKVHFTHFREKMHLLLSQYFTNRMKNRCKKCMSVWGNHIYYWSTHFGKETHFLRLFENAWRSIFFIFNFLILRSGDIRLILHDNKCNLSLPNRIQFYFFQSMPIIKCSELKCNCSLAIVKQCIIP